VTALLLFSAGMAWAGPVGAMSGVGVALLFLSSRRKKPEPPFRAILLVLLVELRSGLSVLGALQQVARSFPDHREMVQAARLATVSGITAAVEAASGETRILLLRLARAQRSGASAARAVRQLLERHIAEERAVKLARAKGLPVRLMVPTALLLLPGLILALYAPSLLRLLGDLTVPL